MSDEQRTYRLQRMTDDERDQVKLLGERIGFGRTIQLAERLWSEALPGGIDPSSNARASLEAEVARLRAHADKVEIARDEYKRAHQVASNDCEMRAREYAQLEAENAELRKHVAHLERMSDHRVRSLSVMKGQRDALEKEILHLSETMSVEQVDELKARLCKLEAENAGLSNLLQMANDVCDRAEADRDALMEELKTAKDMLRESYDRVIAENAELRSEAEYAKRLLGLGPDTPVLKEYGRLDVMWQKLVRDLKNTEDRLAWFKGREGAVRPILSAVTERERFYAQRALLDWERERPKPEGA